MVEEVVMVMVVLGTHCVPKNPQALDALPVLITEEQAPIGNVSTNIGEDDAEGVVHS